MAIRHELALRKELQRVVDTLHNEETSVTPYVNEYRELLDNQGKMLRSSLVIAFASAQAESISPVNQTVITGAAAIEMLHLATLVHDDVLDNAPIRRNRPTAQIEVGNKAAIYLGDLILSRYMEIMATIAPDQEYYRSQAATVRVIVTGELLQESARLHADSTVHNYIQAISGKTAALFKLASQTGIRLSNASPRPKTPEQTTVYDMWVEAAGNFGEQLGIAFQIVDDIEDFNESHNTGKPKLEDISDGIYTLPVLLAIEEDRNFRALLEQGNTEAAVAYLREHQQYFERSRAIAKEYIGRARVILEGLEMRNDTRNLLIDLIDEFESQI